MKDFYRKLTDWAWAPLAVFGGALVLVLLFFRAALAEAGAPVGEPGVIGLPAELLFTSLGGGALGALGVNFLKNRVLPEAAKQLLPVLVPAVYTVVGSVINLLAGTGYAAADIVAAAITAGITSVYSHNVIKHVPKAMGGKLPVAFIVALALPPMLGACAQLREGYDYYRDNIAPHVSVDVPGIIDATIGPKPSAHDNENNPSESGDAAPGSEDENAPSVEEEDASPSDSSVQTDDDSDPDGAAAAFED